MDQIWHPSVELLLKKYADEAQVNEAMHRDSFFSYKKMLTCFQLPIIILSAVSGSMQFLSKSYPLYEGLIVTCTASTSILVSIISAVMSYLKLGELFKQHAVARTQWQQFYIHIRYQLSLVPELRTDSDEFLSEVKTEYEKLFEISPPIEKKFIKKIKKKLRNNNNENFSIPNYCNGLKTVSIYGEDDRNDLL